jgi:hypothetical protein
MLNYGECRVVVHTQFYEYGRPTGGEDFTFKLESDWVMYEEEKVVELVKELLAKKSGRSAYRYEYLSHEVQFVEPTDITEWMRSFLERELMWRRVDAEYEQDRVDAELEFRKEMGE